MLPGPCAFALILRIRTETRDQQAFGTIGSQPHIHFEEMTGRRLYCQIGHQLLCQPCEVARGIQGSRAGRDRVGGRIVQKHQIEIGTEVQLARTQTAVTDGRKLGAGQGTVCILHFSAHPTKHGHQTQLRQIGELAGGGMRINAAIAKRQCSAETGGLPNLIELSQRQIGIAIKDNLINRQFHRLQLHARAGSTRVEQLIEQQRMQTHTLGHQCGLTHHLDQAFQRSGLLVEQGDIGTAAQNRLQQTDQTLERH